MSKLVQKTKSTLKLNKFRGIDLTGDPTECALYRSPDTSNLMIDQTGFPVSRYGYKAIQEYSGHANNEIYGMWQFKSEGGTHLLVHSGKHLYCDGVEILDKNDASVNIYEQTTQMGGDQFDKKFYLVDGHKMVRVYWDSTLTPSARLCVEQVTESSAYVPTVYIHADPSSQYEESAILLEPINALTSYRKKTYLVPDAGATIFYIGSTRSSSGTRENDVVASALGVTKVEVMNHNTGNWETKTITTDYTIVEDTAKKSTYVNFTSPVVKFPIAGVDKVRITYKHTTAPSDQSNILGCTLLSVYGYNGAMDRLVLGGTPFAVNKDWMSEFNNPLYFPDTNYSMVGNALSAIKGYLRHSDGSLAIIKEEVANQPSIFYRTVANAPIEITDPYGMAITKNVATFPLQQGAEGVGAVSTLAFTSFNGDPMFLSKTGAYAIVPVPNAISNEKYAQPRSYYINKALIDTDTSTASMLSIAGLLYLSVGDTLYIADKRYLADVDHSPQGIAQYEWMRWDSIPISVMCEYDGVLHFGSVDGKIFRFKNATDDDTQYLYYDSETVGSDDGVPFKVYWKTPILNFGAVTHFKNIQNLYVVSKPYVRSKVLIRAYIKSVIGYAKGQSVNYFDFNDIDFSDFTFSTDTWSQVIATNRKQRKVMFAQYEVSNESYSKETETASLDGNPFGILELSIRYSFSGNYKGVM